SAPGCASPSPRAARARSRTERWWSRRRAPPRPGVRPAHVRLTRRRRGPGPAPRRGPSCLANRAEEGGAAALHDAADDARAIHPRARLVLAAIDPEPVLEIAERPVGGRIVPQGR